MARHVALAVLISTRAEEAKQVAIAHEQEKAAQERADELAKANVALKRSLDVLAAEPDLAQAFTGIGLQLQAATRFLIAKPEQAQSCLARAHQLAHQGLAQARRSVWALQPAASEYSDLVTVLRRIAAQLTADTSVQAEVLSAGTPRLVPPDIGMNLLRIGQEALTNALRHAQAHCIQILINYHADYLQLCIRDDGWGVDAQRQINSGGFGLSGMQQRAERIGAQLAIASASGRGTEVTVTVALTKD